MAQSQTTDYEQHRGKETHNTDIHTLQNTKIVKESALILSRRHEGALRTPTQYEQQQTIDQHTTECTPANVTRGGGLYIVYFAQYSDAVKIQICSAPIQSS